MPFIISVELGWAFDLVQEEMRFAGLVEMEHLMEKLVQMLGLPFEAETLPMPEQLLLLV